MRNVTIVSSTTYVTLVMSTTYVTLTTSTTHVTLTTSTTYVTPTTSTTYVTLTTSTTYVTPTTNHAGLGTSRPCDLDAGLGTSRQCDLDAGLGTSRPCDLDVGLGTSRPCDLDAGLGTSRPCDLDAGLGTSRPCDLDVGLGTSRPCDLDATLGTSRSCDLDAGLGTSRPCDLDAALGTSRPCDLDAGLGTSRPCDLDAALGTSRPCDLDAGLGTSRQCDLDAALGTSRLKGVLEKCDWPVYRRAVQECGDVRTCVVACARVCDAEAEESSFRERKSRLFVSVLPHPHCMNNYVMTSAMNNYVMVSAMNNYVMVSAMNNYVMTSAMNNYVMASAMNNYVMVSAMNNYVMVSAMNNYVMTWRGSVYKLVWPDMLIYLFLFFVLSFVYRFALDEEAKTQFEKASVTCAAFVEFIPLSFVLGFYVSIVVQRWWAQWETLPWPDTLALFVSTTLSGNDMRGRMMRRTIMRYANLSMSLTFSMISPGVKKRFPTVKHFEDAGFLTKNERKIYASVAGRTPHAIYWMPFVWAGALVTRARKEKRIKDDLAVKTIIDEITRLRTSCGSILGYDSINIPLVYTQVVTWSVYSFFLASLMGRQFLDPTKGYDKNTIDFYFPVFTTLQFFFYMGWLKVAESLVNPFGDDDDDFEMNFLVDRNLQVSYLIVDEMHNEHPELIQDKYWDEVVPHELPYTEASQEYRTTDRHLGSTACMDEATLNASNLTQRNPKATLNPVLDLSNPQRPTLNLVAQRLRGIVSPVFEGDVPTTVESSSRNPQEMQVFAVSAMKAEEEDPAPQQEQQDGFSVAGPQLTQKSKAVKKQTAAMSQSHFQAQLFPDDYGKEYVV
ncbi:Bestrophin/UPF0187 [Trinorchestia longiramus]|nr:Bestrophin/UPF0187 [Trinorchestia longiramus]